MQIVERFRAAPNERRIWAVCYASAGLAFLAWAVWTWDVPWTVPAAVLGAGIVACAIAHELYRRRWGTLGLIGAATLLAAAVVAFIATGILPWRPVYLVGPALCLGGAVVLWRDRPTDSERFIVPQQVKNYIRLLEKDLRRIKPETPFHSVPGRGFLGQVDSAAEWLMAVYDDGATEFRVTALYVEMERFDINTDRWFLTGYAYKMPPAEMFEDMHFNLGEYESAYEGEFTLTGMEDLQDAFEQASQNDDLFTSERPEDCRLLEAMGAAFDLITARMQELVAAAHRAAGRRGHPVGGIRVFANAHDTLWLNLCSPLATGKSRGNPLLQGQRRASR